MWKGWKTRAIILSPKKTGLQGQLTHNKSAINRQEKPVLQKKKLFLNVNDKRLMTSDRKLKNHYPKDWEKMSKMGEKIPIWNYTFTFADLVNLRTQTGFQHSFLELFLKVATGIIQVAEFQLITCNNYWEDKPIKSRS